MPVVRRTNDPMSGESSTRNHRNWTRRHRSTPQYQQRALYPGRPISRPNNVAQPRRRTLSLWEVHAKTIQRREKRLEREERRRIASSLPVAVSQFGPPHLRSVDSATIRSEAPQGFGPPHLRSVDSATIRSEAPQGPVDQVYEETPTEPDEVATEIDEQTERDSAKSKDEESGDAEVGVTITQAERRSAEQSVQRNLEMQAESLLRDVIGPCVGQKSDPPSREQPHATPEFVQGSSRDVQIGNQPQSQAHAERVRGWLNSQSAFQTEGTVDTTPAHSNLHETTLSVSTNHLLYPAPEPQHATPEFVQGSSRDAQGSNQPQYDTTPAHSNLHETTLSVSTNPLLYPAPEPQHATPEFVQGSSRGAQVGNQPQLHDTTPAHSNLHETTLSVLTNPLLYPAPEPQPPVSCTPAPINTNADHLMPPVSCAPMDIVADLMDTSPDPEDFGTFSTSLPIPPQPMQDIQPTSAQVVNFSATSTSNTPLDILSQSFDRRALLNPFASNPQPQWHINFNSIHLSTPPPIILLPARSDAPSGVTSQTCSYLNPFLNASWQSRPQPEQPTHSGSPSVFDQPFLTAPVNERESYHGFTPLDWCITCGQTLTSRHPALSETLTAPNCREEEVSVNAKEEEEKVDPFIIEACKEQEAWWDATPGSRWAKVSRSDWGSSQQNGIFVLDVTRPIHTCIARRNASTRRPAPLVDDTDNVTRSLERFDERLAQRVNTEELWHSYSSHIENAKSQSRKRSTQRSPKHLFKSPRSFHKRSFKTRIQRPRFHFFSL